MRVRVPHPYARCSRLLGEALTILDYAFLIARDLGARQRRALQDLRPGQRVAGWPYPKVTREGLCEMGLVRLDADGCWSLTPLGALIREVSMHKREELADG